MSILNPFTLHRKSRREKAFFALGLVCFFWGTTWVASRAAVEGMPALQMAGIRQLISGILIVGYFLFRRSAFPKGKDWIVILSLALVNFVISNSFVAWGLQYIPSGLGSIIGATYPIWLVLIGLIGGKARLSRKAAAGFLLGFGGICIIFYEHLADLFDADFQFGIFLSVLATITWAIGTVFTKKYANGFDPYFSMGIQMLISGSVLLGTTKSLSLAGLPTFLPFAAIPVQSWLGIAYLIVFGTLVAYGSYLYALQVLTVEQTSIYAYINPVVALILGYLLFRESLTFFIAAGGLVTLLGVYLVNQSFADPGQGSVEEAAVDLPSAVESSAGLPTAAESSAADPATPVSDTTKAS